MKKSTKGAVAAAGAAVVLLGGAGTLAYWSDSETVSGGAINTGHLSLDNPTCAANWVLDAKESAADAPYVPGTTKLVPGDVITKTCTYVLNLKGEHLRATVAASTPAAAPAHLTVEKPAVTLAGTPVTEVTEADDAKTIAVDLKVTFNSASENTTQDLTHSLDNITLSLSQVHA